MKKDYTKLMHKFREAQLESLQMLCFDDDMPTIIAIRIGGLALRIFTSARDQLRLNADALTA